MIRMKTNHLFLAVIVVLTTLFAGGCSLGVTDKFRGEFILDNPTDFPLKVTVDGKPYELPAYGHEKLKLDAGRHSMTTSYGETVDFLVTVENNGGVLNPTRSVYYVYTMVYVREGHEDRSQRFADLMIEGVEYEAPAREVGGVVIDEKTVDWQFPIHTPFDEVTYVDRDAVVAAARYKLFTKKELVDFIEEGTEYVGFHEENRAKPESPVPYYEPAEEKAFFVPDFKNEEIKRLATEMVALDKEFGQAESASRQKELLSEYRSLWKTYVETNLKEEYDEAEFAKQAQLEFHHFSKGVIVL